MACLLPLPPPSYFLTLPNFFICNLLFIFVPNRLHSPPTLYTPGSLINILIVCNLPSFWRTPTRAALGERKKLSKKYMKIRKLLKLALAPVCEIRIPSSYFKEKTSNSENCDIRMLGAKGMAMVEKAYWCHESVNYTFVFVVISIDYFRRNRLL